MNHKTYIVRFSGQNITTTVTNISKPVDEWVNDVRLMQGRLIVGLDCEWRPHPIPEMSNKTATLQLCVQNKCLIVQIIYMAHIPESLKSFLSDPSITFVGVGVGQDASKLRDEYGLIVANAVDLETLAMAYRDWSFYGRPRPGLKGFAWGVAGLFMEKPRHVTKSNWEARVLSLQNMLALTLMLLIRLAASYWFETNGVFGYDC